MVWICHPLKGFGWSLVWTELANLWKKITTFKKNFFNEQSVFKEQQADASSTYIFPGAGGIDELVLDLQAAIPNSKIIDWKKHRWNNLTAGFDGEAVGEAIADLFLQEKNDRTNCVHYIGISVGAFCANAAATSTFLRNEKDSKSEVQLTLLDPFCGRGILDPNYGRRHFGKYATKALQILNTDDPVPTTNDPLPNCCCIDVTNTKQKENFVPLPGDSGMHSWPVAYFARHYNYSQESYMPLERGSVIRAD